MTVKGPGAPLAVGGAEDPGAPLAVGRATEARPAPVAGKDEPPAAAPAKDKPTTTKEPDRWHAGMRLVLAIVAGAIISEVLKVSVETFVGDGQKWWPRWPNTIVLFAVLVFVANVLIANVAYYEKPDPLDGEHRFLRPLLSVTDLLSYVLCYIAVVVFNRGVEGKLEHVGNPAFWGLVAMVGVEALHVFWCAGLRMGKLVRGADFVRTWGVASLASCGLGALAVCSMAQWTDGSLNARTATIVALFVAVSRLIHLIVRKEWPAIEPSNVRGA